MEEGEHEETDDQRRTRTAAAMFEDLANSRHTDLIVRSLEDNRGGLRGSYVRKRRGHALDSDDNSDEENRNIRRMNARRAYAARQFERYLDQVMTESPPGSPPGSQTEMS